MFNAPSALLVARSVSGERSRVRRAAVSAGTPRTVVRRAALRRWGGSSPSLGGTPSARPSGCPTRS